MARKPMVTRTLISTKAEVLCMDVATATPVTREVILPRTYKNDVALLKAVEQVVTDVKPVHIQSSSEIEKLYGMTESDFLKYAVELDAETRKPLSTEAPIPTEE